MAGGTAATGTVVLNSAAPAGGLVVPLSDNSTAVTVPASVTVPAGATSATFPVNTERGDGGHHRHDLGHAGHDAERHAGGDAEPRPRPSTFVSLTTQNVVGGGSATGRVVLSAAALPGGAVVTLTSDSPAVTVPASVTVPADAVAVLVPRDHQSGDGHDGGDHHRLVRGHAQSIRLNVSPRRRARCWPR